MHDEREQQNETATVSETETAIEGTEEQVENLDLQGEETVTLERLENIPHYLVIAEMGKMGDTLEQQALE
jgi:hypothetical protein